jgi:MarR family transcriptional regulator for hemolysin
MIDSSLNAIQLAERFESALRSTARDWRHAVDRRLKHLGVSLASWMTIEAVSQVHSPLSQSELAEKLAVSSASMVHMIDRLVKAGLVVRESSSDRRVKHIVITDAGNRLYAQIKDEVSAARQQFLASIELQSLAHLTQLLEQLQCVLQPYHDCADETQWSATSSNICRRPSFNISSAKSGSAPTTARDSTKAPTS